MGVLNLAAWGGIITIQNWGKGGGVFRVRGRGARKRGKPDFRIGERRSSLFRNVGGGNNSYTHCHVKTLSLHVAPSYMYMDSTGIPYVPAIY